MFSNQQLYIKNKKKFFHVMLDCDTHKWNPKLCSRFVKIIWSN